MVKTLKDTIEGQAILIWVNSENRVTVNNTRPGVLGYNGVKMIPATVLSVSISSVSLGWKDGELTPADSMFTASIAQAWKDKGIIVSLNYSSKVEYKDNGGKDGMCVDQPCKICKRKNDVGINSCWWCGIDQPTAFIV